MKYIGIGNWNIYNLYLLIAFISEILISLVNGLNSANKEKQARLFPFRAKIKDHNLLNNFIRLTSIFFGGIILYFFERRNKSKAKGEVKIENYEKMKDKLYDNKGGSIFFNLLLVK